MKECFFLVMVFGLTLFPGLLSAQTFSNAATDSKESPFIQRMIVTSDDNNLVLRIEGELNLGRKMAVVHRVAGPAGTAGGG